MARAKEPKKISFVTPSEVRRSFAVDSAITSRSKPRTKINEKRSRRSTTWPKKTLDYAYLEKCKELVCRLKHPTQYFQFREAEYRVSIMSWSRGSYLDVRMYKRGAPTSVGILLHLDVALALLPEITMAVRQMENADTRDESQKNRLQVISARSDGLDGVDTVLPQVSANFE